MTRKLRRAVPPVRNPRGAIGTATVIGDGLALTALHVIAPEDPGKLWLGDLPVKHASTLTLDGYPADALPPAHRSWRRGLRLAGAGIDTVDLALLLVPGLRAEAPPVRSSPVRVGEPLVVPGYPCGRWGVTQGPVTGTDGADFGVQLLLGPGASGAPALDEAGRLAGVVTLDHEAATICVGPSLVTTFLRRLGVPN